MVAPIYLTFNGDCEQALTFYADVLGGKVLAQNTFAEGPGNEELTDPQRDKIMHMSVDIGGFAILGSDDLSANTDFGSNFAIVLTPDSEEAAKRQFESFADQGAVVVPLDKTFWGALFGQVKDQFGIQWMINCETSS